MALLLPLGMQAQLKDLVDKARGKVEKVTGGDEIGNGLKAALQQGVEKQVAKLAAQDGFNKNEAVRILFPPELQRVEQALRMAGLHQMADSGIRSMNRAAEEAVKEATPVFMDAIGKMTFADARSILTGGERAATSYLENTTAATLHQRFLPIVRKNFEQVGADKAWATLINRYNQMPLVKKVNPDMNDYVTKKALDGVYLMIAREEKEIRTRVEARTTPLLRKVFAQQ